MQLKLALELEILVPEWTLHHSRESSIVSGAPIHLERAYAVAQALVFQLRSRMRAYTMENSMLGERSAKALTSYLLFR
jgi:hypothetical protein